MDNIKCIQTGCTRQVFLIGKYAIKIPTFIEYRLFLKGILGNLQEARFSKMGWPELLPILFRGPFGLFNIFPRVKPLTDLQFENLCSWENFNIDKFLEKENYKIPAEKKSDSFAIYKNTLVVIDYGD